MNEALETIEQDGFTGRIYYDEGTDSPREWDNCSVLAQLSSRFTAPDNDSRADALIEAWDRYDRNVEKVERYARAFLDAVAVAWWDDPRSESRIVGIITREIAEREQLSDPLATLVSELDTYREWCDGEVYYWTVEDEDGNEVESCGDCYGSDYVMSEVKAAIASAVADRHAKRIAMYRALTS